MVLDSWNNGRQVVKSLTDFLAKIQFSAFHVLHVPGLGITLGSSHDDSVDVFGVSVVMTNNLFWKDPEMRRAVAHVFRRRSCCNPSCCAWMIEERRRD